MYPRLGVKRRIDDTGLEDEEAINSLCRLSSCPSSSESRMDLEKRSRREIANSNERRRMQSINAGFASLKSLLPHHEGEKLSKAAILQHTAEYIYQLEQEKTRLLTQNCQLKRLLNQQQHSTESEGSPLGSDSPSAESRGTPPVEGVTKIDISDDAQQELQDLRMQLEIVRSQYAEEKELVRTLQEKLQSDKNTQDQTQCMKYDGSSSKTDSCIPPEHLLKYDGTSCKAEPRDAADHHHHLVGESLVTNDRVVPIHSVPIMPSGAPRNSPVCSIPAGTIVKVVPSKPAGMLSASVFNVLTQSFSITGAPKVEVEPTPRIPSPSATIEEIEDDSIVQDTMTSSGHKSLNTIYEAIRHVEGDHMFLVEDQASIEEEVITEETLAIDDQNSFLGPVTLQMVPPEPQDAPLELTTSHRSCEEPKFCIPCTESSSSPLPEELFQDRPGVIVVKQP